MNVNKSIKAFVVLCMLATLSANGLVRSRSGRRGDVRGHGRYSRRGTVAPVVGAVTGAALVGGAISSERRDRRLDERDDSGRSVAPVVGAVTGAAIVGGALGARRRGRIDNRTGSRGYSRSSGGRSSGGTRRRR
ncbi:hypothetical protein ACFLYU_04325 [Candidatus Dependentiae bacterium]